MTTRTVIRKSKKKPTASDIALLEMFTPEVAGIALTGASRDRLWDAGYIEWCGSPFGSPMFRCTDAGRAALAQTAKVSA